MGIRHHIRGYRISWRKLIIAACVMTTAGAMLQSCTIPYPLNIWFILPPLTVSSYKTLNSTVQVKDSLPSQVRIEQFAPVNIASFHSMNSTASRVSVSEVEEKDAIFPMVNPSNEREHTVNLDKEKPIKPKVVAQPPKTASISGHGIHSSLPEEPIASVNSSTTTHPSVPKVEEKEVVFPEVTPHGKEHTVDVNKEKRTNPKAVVQLLKPASASGLGIHGSHPEEPIASVNSSTTTHLSVPKVEGRGVVFPEVKPPYGKEHTVDVNKEKHTNPKAMAQLLKPASASSHGIRSSHPQKPIWSLPPDQALDYAKKEIENAPIVADCPDLHPPLFRNVSIFKRSYELMEKILKVYVYRDGRRPIFHTPHLSGIYASEGWFMRLMEINKQFVVKDPSKAHLFYLPYSARQLELALYVPGSHNMRPLSLFLRDYVNEIAAKYPFWNRTRGSDHFLVACHDWGPYTLTEHEELCKNTIKALCNADASEGIFSPGKDVSLPETTIRNPRKPLRYLGGKPVSKRSILAFFAGNMHGRVRPILLEYWDGKDEDMKIYGPLPDRVSRKMSYIEHMKTSKFCLCPMGYEVNSPRIVEAIYYECVPVIIADNFVPPFNDALDWSAFSVIVAEKDIPKLKEILLAISLRRYVFMQTNVKRLQKHFLWHYKPEKYDIFHMILHSIWFNRLNQIQHQ